MNDNMNARKAYEYMHELNKYQYYMTVVKEYEELQERVKNSRSYGGSQNKLLEWETRLESQYSYALDHMNLRAQSSGYNDDGSAEVSNAHIAVDLGYSILVLLCFAGLIFYLEPFSKTELGGTGTDKFKFDIKKA